MLPSACASSSCNTEMSSTPAPKSGAGVLFVSGTFPGRANGAIMRHCEGDEARRGNPPVNAGGRGFGTGGTGKPVPYRDPRRGSRGGHWPPENCRQHSTSPAYGRTLRAVSRPKSDNILVHPQYLVVFLPISIPHLVFRQHFHIPGGIMLTWLREKVEPRRRWHRLPAPPPPAPEGSPPTPQEAPAEISPPGAALRVRLRRR